MVSKNLLFPALLKSWRHRRGLSQLDLALTAEISSRHLSFLETGRAQPSADMVLRLCAALDVPLRDQNALLSAADHAPAFAEPPTTSLPAVVDRVLDRMCAQQEPYPLVVLSGDYDMMRLNDGGARLLPLFVKDPNALTPGLNLYDLTFDARLARDFVDDWDNAARVMVARLHREVLARPGDARMSALLARVLAMPGVPKSWHLPDFSDGDTPVLGVRLRRDALALSFVTVVTAFSAPLNVTMEELRIEAWFPADDVTTAFCASLAAD